MYLFLELEQIIQTAKASIILNDRYCIHNILLLWDTSIGL